MRYYDYFEISFPRPRGDEPLVTSVYRLGAGFSPPTRG